MSSIVHWCSMFNVQKKQKNNIEKWILLDNGLPYLILIIVYCFRHLWELRMMLENLVFQSKKKKMLIILICVTELTLLVIQTVLWLGPKCTHFYRISCVHISNKFDEWWVKFATNGRFLESEFATLLNMLGNQYELWILLLSLRSYFLPFKHVKYAPKNKNRVDYTNKNSIEKRIFE